MLTKLLLLIGAMKNQKQQREFFSRPAQVMSPLSPNHGPFGGGSLYAECKITLEALLTGVIQKAGLRSYPYMVLLWMDTRDWPHGRQ
jgi:3-oxoacyl-ACP reductase-like protein